MRKLVFTLMALLVLFTLLRVYADIRTFPPVGITRQSPVGGTIP